MGVWWSLGIVVVVGVGTYLLRAAPLLLLTDRELPMVVQRALRNVGPAVLAALVVVSVASGGEGVEIELAEIVALTAGGLVAWWRKNLIWSLLAGMGALWVFIAMA